MQGAGVFLSLMNAERARAGDRDADGAAWADMVSMDVARGDGVRGWPACSSPWVPRTWVRARPPACGAASPGQQQHATSGIHRAADAGLPVRCTVARELPDDEHHVAVRAQGALRATTA
ncbi:hypothetical protein GCM10009646_20590 [Streptomyces aureus]